MSVIGPIGLLVLVLPAIRWLTPRVDAWIPERRRLLAISVVASFLLMWIMTQIVAVQHGGVPLWELIVTPFLVGVAMGAGVVLVLYVQLWLLDHVYGRYQEALIDFTYSLLPPAYEKEFRRQSMRGPFWGLFTPVDVIKAARGEQPQGSDSD